MPNPYWTDNPGSFATITGGAFTPSTLNVTSTATFGGTLYVTSTATFAGTTNMGTSVTLGAALASTAGSTQTPNTWNVPDSNATILQTQTFRHATGTDWTTCDQYIGKKVDSTYMGFIGFYSSAGKNGTNGIGMGYNAGATSWDSVGPCFYVNGNNVMINLGGLALFNYGSGSPNGTVNATTGQILWDTTNSKLWVCTGGTSWKGVALT